MKLIDILARDLDVWPEGLECLSQLKGTGYIINGKGFDGRAFDALEIADETNIAGAIVTRSEWQAAVDALKAEAAPAWVGVGLPPVGTVCEHGRLIPGEWCVVEIVAHHRFKGCGFLSAVYVHDDGVGHASAGDHFRPIRTPEQIAADQYEEDAAEIAKILRDLKNADEIFVAKTLLDCGYRKFEIVDKDDGEGEV